MTELEQIIEQIEDKAHELKARRSDVGRARQLLDEAEADHRHLLARKEELERRQRRADLEPVPMVVERSENRESKSVRDAGSYR